MGVNIFIVLIDSRPEQGPARLAALRQAIGEPTR